MTQNLARILIPLGAVLCLWPAVPSAAALVGGILIALAFGNPYVEKTRALTPRMLSLSVIGLGAAMNLLVVARVGAQGFVYTAIGITFAIVVGTLLGRFLKTETNTSLLITVGTAICGGSAIAALAPTIRAKSHEITVALATVFLLNALGLLIFPPLGHHFGLDQIQFGLWSALAIHDTSSVVGSAIQYGPQALEVGTTVKLARALWIVPVTFAVGYFAQQANSQNSDGSKPKTKKPWFILGFLIAAAIVTWIPMLQPTGEIVASVARRTLVVTLFLIGAGFSRETLKKVGARPFIQGIVLWITVASLTLAAILAGWIRA
ncbi:MAG TPA: putative sulfate exporter family transporter [Bdellovibrionales bacterium]|nr:putative sulfate exporter family transporter [Bdellovibrionales bacterium]